MSWRARRTPELPYTLSGHPLSRDAPEATGPRKLSSLHGDQTIAVGAEPRKKFDHTRIDARPSRQPLVKGERLVRFEVSAAMPPRGGIPLTTLYPLLLPASPKPGGSRFKQKRPGVAETAGSTSLLRLPTQTHCPSTKHVERFCLLCFQPKPVLASLSARTPQASAKSPLRNMLLERGELST